MTPRLEFWGEEGVERVVLLPVDVLVGARHELFEVVEELGRVGGKLDDLGRRSRRRGHTHLLRDRGAKFSPKVSQLLPPGGGGRPKGGRYCPKDPFEGSVI